MIVYAGVDYERILRQAENEVDIVLWDGGNNDFSFYQSDLAIVVADPHRPGNEVGYHPGETNLHDLDRVDTATIAAASSARESQQANRRRFFSGFPALVDAPPSMEAGSGR